MNTSAWVLIIVFNHFTGSMTTTAEFSTEQNCLSAGKAIVAQAKKQENHSAAWGCFKK